MWCPVHHWHRISASRKEQTWLRLRGVLPGLLRSLAALSFLGHGVVLYAELDPDNVWEPPPGHPERMVPPDSPATTAEREIWASLEGINWW